MPWYRAFSEALRVPGVIGGIVVSTGTVVVGGASVGGGALLWPEWQPASRLAENTTATPTALRRRGIWRRESSWRLERWMFMSGGPLFSLGAGTSSGRRPVAAHCQCAVRTSGGFGWSQQVGVPPRQVLTALRQLSAEPHHTPAATHSPLRVDGRSVILVGRTQLGARTECLCLNALPANSSTRLHQPCRCPTVPIRCGPSCSSPEDLPTTRRCGGCTH